MVGSNLCPSNGVDLHKLVLEGQSPPSPEQICWVLRHLYDHLTEGGTFRYLIYDRLKLQPLDYYQLYESGGMAISNAFSELKDLQNEERNKDASQEIYSGDVTRGTSAPGA